MNEKDFGAGAPGRLVAASAVERRERGGRSEAVMVSGVAFVPNPLPPQVDRASFVYDVFEDVMDAERSLATLEGAVSALPDRDLLLRPMRMTEARLSSQIENTVATVEEVALFDATKSAPRNEVVEVWNYLQALDEGLASDWHIGEKLFLKLHSTLMKDAEGGDKRPGEFRTGQVYIGEHSRGFRNARYVPPPPGRPMMECLSTLEKFLNLDALMDVDPPPLRLPALVEIALAHYQFEAIHPFNDGNGRLGRLLIILSLVRRNMLSGPYAYVSGYFEANGQEYYDCLLGVSTHGEWSQWVRYFCRGLAEQAKDGLNRARKLHNLREEYIRLVSGLKASGTSIKLVESLFRQPALTITDAATRLKVGYPAAQRHVQQLVALGILVQIGKADYGKEFIAHDILKTADGRTRTSGRGLTD